MIERMIVKNFRSIEDCDLRVAPVTILYGPTAGGKSTLMYAALVLRNFVLNPSQAVDGLFSLGFQNLGGYEACVFNHDPMRKLEVSIVYRQGMATGKYGASFTKTGATISLDAHELTMSCSVPIPYGLNQTFSFTYSEEENEFDVGWNGVSSSVTPKTPTAQLQARAQEVAAQLNASVEALRRVDVAPHKRGFLKPTYSPQPVSAMPTAEDEVASIIINDMNLPPRVSVCTEEIFDRDFRTYIPPGSALVYFQTTEKKARVPVLLVNDGFGVNQVIYLLAKINRGDVDTLLIEEPEAHLHPSVIRRFARVLCKLVKEDDKQVILSTHSEQFVLSILACVRERRIGSEDVRCYLVTRPNRTTVFEHQAVGENGQIEGGLSTFMEAETEDLRQFVSLKPQE